MMLEPTQEQIEEAARAMMFPTIGKPSGYWLNKAEAALKAAAAVYAREGQIMPEPTQEQIEAAARAIWQTLFPHLPYQTGCSAAAQAALKAVAALTPEKKD